VEQISTCSLWKGLHTGAGGCLKEAVTLWGARHWRQSVRSPSPEAEGVAETTCDELTITLIPHPPAQLGERRK